MSRRKTKTMTIDTAKQLLNEKSVYLTEEGKRLLEQMVNK